MEYPKHIFLTGVTGFVGKSVLEKVIRSLPDDVITYVLVRRKGSTSGPERLENELFVSEIFERVRKEKGMQDEKTFFKYMHGRVKAVEGDVSMKGLGISEAVMNTVIRAHVELAIHCAASVDFDERLDLAIGNNILGALETLGLCVTCPKITRIVHVSTAYVSVNQTSRKKIPEQIPELEFDYDALVKQALSLRGDLKELEIFTQKVLHENKFPNTYTLTKAISEAMIQRKFGQVKHVSIHIVRPSIVGSAWKEPVPGWIDSVSAASAVFLASAMGILTLLPGNPRGVSDMVPVDIVANHILLAGIKPQTTTIRVSHCCSSMENPVRWRVLHDSVQRSFVEIGLPRSRLNIGSRVGMKMISDPTMFKLEWTLCYDVPAFMLRAVANVTRNPQHVKTAKLMTMLTDRAGKVIELFTPFTANEYFFSAETSIGVWLDEAAKGDPYCSKFNVDIRDVAWSAYFFNYVYGLLRFVLHEDVIPVTEINVSHNNLKLNTERLITWDADHHAISFPGLLPDITWAYTQSRAPGYTTSGDLLGRALGITGWREGLNHEAKYVGRRTIRRKMEMEALVLDSTMVMRAVRSEANRNAKRSAGKATRRTTGESSKEVNYLKQARVAMRAKAESIYRRLATTLEDQPPRAFGWFLRKIWRQLFDGIRVDELGLDRMRSLLVANSNKQEKARPVVLLPSHRSYVDFLVLSYIMFAYNIPVPHIAASEDFLNMGPVSNLLRASGAFFIKRDSSPGKEEDVLYQEIFREYLFRLLEDGQVVEFFLEGTRSRSGKSLFPKSGMMKMLSDAITTGRVDDVLLIPISISYERPLEVSLYAEELLGSSKPRETLWNLLKGASALGRRFGTIHLQFSDPVSLRGLSSISSPTVSPALKLIRAIDTASACFTTHLVATLLLMYRNGAAFEQLLRGLDFLRGEVYKRGGRVIDVEGMRPEEVLTRALDLLNGLIAKRDVPALYQVDWSPRNWTNFLALSYYRNHIIHLFCEESIWAAVIHSRSKQSRIIPVASKVSTDAVIVDSKGKARFLGSPSHNESELAAVVQINATQEELIEDVKFLQAMLSREFVSSDLTDAHALSDLERRGVVEVNCKNKSIIVRESKSFALLCSIIWPVIDGYFVAATSLFALLNGNSIPLKELSSRMLALAETLYLDGIVMHYESCSTGTLTNSLQTFHEWGVLKYTKVALPKMLMQGQEYRTDVSLCAEFDSRGALGSLVGKIDKLRKRGHRDFSVEEAGTPFGVAHFPALARM